MTKSVLLFIGIFGTVIALFGQQKKQTPTREETQQWISEKIRVYSYESPDGKAINKYGISFKDDNMFIEQKTILTFPQFSQEVHGIKRVPIKLIESVSFKDKTNSYAFAINMKDGANVIISEFDGLPVESNSFAEIMLSKTLDDENLKERMVKAFNFLVESYTGKAKKKEPF